VNPPNPPVNSPPAPPPPTATATCEGTASCFTAEVTHIVDGDTLDVGGTRIRLALVDTPEVGNTGYAEASDATARICPVGSDALVDEDDGQTGGSYGRMIAVVFCGNVNLNAALLTEGYAVLVPYYCSVSEFAPEAWTGCP
jgi:micrococcal nuclease